MEGTIIHPVKGLLNLINIYHVAGKEIRSYNPISITTIKAFINLRNIRKRIIDRIDELKDDKWNVQYINTLCETLKDSDLIDNYSDSLHLYSYNDNKEYRLDMTDRNHKYSLTTDNGTTIIISDIEYSNGEKYRSNIVSLYNLSDEANEIVDIYKEKIIKMLNNYLDSKK